MGQRENPMTYFPPAQGQRHHQTPLPPKSKFTSILAQAYSEVFRLQSDNTTLKCHLENIEGHAIRLQQQMQQQIQGMQEYIEVLEAQNQDLRQKAGYVDHPIGTKI